jgi:DHA2 family multidrug resistance protein-like MFS transporter
VLGTIATANFPTYLADRLVSTGVPDTTAHTIVSNAGHGQAPTTSTALTRIVSDAIPRALTSAIHLGWLTAGIVLLVMAVPAALFVRHSSPAK